MTAATGYRLSSVEEIEMKPVPAIAPRVVLHQAVFKMLSGREVLVKFPSDLTDDDLCVLVMELTKNLRQSVRAQELASHQVRSPGVELPGGRA